MRKTKDQKTTIQRMAAYAFMVLILLFTCVGSPTVTVEAADLTYTDSYGTWTYTVDGNNHVTITKYSGSGTNVTVPATIDGKTVTSIGEHAFYGKSITKVTIPNGVTNIGISAFLFCNKLSSVTIPSSVKTIERQAFDRCTSLTDITLPNGLQEIGGSVFSDCSSLTSLTIPDSVTTIGASAFAGCDGLTSIVIPKNVTSIGDSVLAKCNHLESITVATGNKKYDSRNGCNAIIETSANKLVAGCNTTTIPDSVTEIAMRAFYGFDKVTKIKISKYVTDISGEAFFCCENVEEIIVDGANPKYDSRNNCNAIIERSTDRLLIGCQNTIIPSNVKAIADRAFNRCINLKAVTIPENVTSVGYCTFADCKSLTEITIPQKVTSISQSAFSGCDNLESITFAEGSKLNQIGNYAFDDCISLKSIEIPNGVTVIKDRTFSGCKSLSSVTIPTSVTEIQNGAFENVPA